MNDDRRPTPPRSKRRPDQRLTSRRPPRHASGQGDAVEQFAGQLGTQVPDALRFAGVPLVTAALVAGGTGVAQAAPQTAGPQPGAAPAGLDLVTVVPGAVQAKYTVKAGDTVSHIAVRTGVPARTILSANGLPASGLIRIGQTLVLPGYQAPAATTTKKPAAKPAAKPAKPATATYVIASGDTLQSIASRYKITVAGIARANSLADIHLIHPGKKLVLPGVAAPAKTTKTAPKSASPAKTTNAAAKQTYVVREGDSLSGISGAKKVPLATILDLNKLTRASVIHPGQKLLLPADAKPKVPNTFLGRTYPDAVAQAAATNRATLAAAKVPSRTKMRAMVATRAKSMGVDPALALAIAYQESGFNQRAVSPANAIGTMQVLPGTGVWAGDLVGRKLDLLKAEDNVTAGVAVLAALLARADDDDAIAGYYQGLASVLSKGMYKDTKAYVANITAHRKKFAKELAAG